jgi:hypothetical protein
VTAGELIGRWERIAAQPVALNDDDWLNDVDVRQLLHDLSRTERAPYRERLRTADAAFKAATLPVRTCLWGEANARRHGWTRRRNWWYYRIPAAGLRGEN